jgi:Flp pilus assembly pilin Flp
LRGGCDPPASNHSHTPQKTGEDVMSRLCTIGLRSASRLIRDDRGTEIVEYALLLGMLVCACIAFLSALGTKVMQRWSRVNEMF